MGISDWINDKRTPTRVKYELEQCRQQNRVLELQLEYVQQIAQQSSYKRLVDLDDKIRHLRHLPKLDYWEKAEFQQKDGYIVKVTLTGFSGEVRTYELEWADPGPLEMQDYMTWVRI